MFSLDPRWLPFKLIIKRTELKIYLYELRYFNFANTPLQGSLECKNENFQNIEKISIMLTFFYAGVFTSFRYLNTMMWFENTDPFTREEKNDFFLATFTSSFYNFKYIYVLEDWGSWGLNFGHAWHDLIKRPVMIWDMLRSMHLHDFLFWWRLTV